MVTEKVPGTVLVVDDDPGALTTLEALLDDQFQVTLAADVAEAESALNSSVFDVVVTDYQMPGRTGLDLLKICTENFPLTVGMLVTGFGELPAIQQLVSQEDRPIVLLKPYDPEHLIRSVKSAMRVARMRRATARLKSFQTPGV